MDWIKLAREIGFEDACMLNMDALKPMREVREMCSADRCKVYGKRWSCPPACGSIEHCKSRIKRYNSGVLVQTTGALEDDFDLAGIEASHKIHNHRFATMARQALSITCDSLALSAGACTRCDVCTYPKSLCRYPGKALSSMEAFGLLVSQVCSESGMAYFRGEKTISFTSCILFNIKENDT